VRERSGQARRAIAGDAPDAGLMGVGGGQEGGDDARRSGEDGDGGGTAGRQSRGVAEPSKLDDELLAGATGLRLGIESGLDCEAGLDMAQMVSTRTYCGRRRASRRGRQ
jgi:hypothetical protein